eukprot:TRINITY_DN180_c0_g1_i1.p1 TRINITY_DN180_c0_g1~~TRINITY_DN180_c0_g1_i1.p1  ORF type:complete len:745 (-),score=182.80 TRINITY_DN180_c0_g1_i1:412-2646(-)
MKKQDPVAVASPSSGLVSTARQLITRLQSNEGKQALLLKFLILALIYLLAFVTRLFSVLRYESVIHEFDPYFNFRSTKYLVNEGFYNFINWFDEDSWYPLGRIVGGTVYPGLMFTAAGVYWILNALSLTVNIRNVCVLLAPFFASNTAVVTYLLGKEARDEATGLMAAALIAIVPGYISRSVAGSFDNEGIAIFALIFTYYLWVKSVKSGSMLHAAGCALAYFYMVAAWGGYIFIINLIPLHTLVLLITGRFSNRLYVAYNTFYILGTLMSMQITFVGFQPVQSSEHMAAMGVFVLLNVWSGVLWVRSQISAEQFRYFFKLSIGVIAAVGAAVVAVGFATGYISPFTGRFYSLLDPTYAKEHIPIIASVSEHQPTTWSSFFFDLHFLVFCFPAGLYFLFRDMTDEGMFLILYGVSSVYFAGVMVRLMLVLAPVACLLSAVGISNTLNTFLLPLKQQPATPAAATPAAASPDVKKGGKQQAVSSRRAERDAKEPNITRDVSMLIAGGMTIMLALYVFHCSWVTSEAYSSPSIVLAAKQQDGSRLIFDDFREAYSWLRHNTAPNARVMSWWDYGYQISAMANRTIIVDNNTWNNTHIATVGRAMSANESAAYEVMTFLDVDYVLVIFGGLTGYASDDINKFLWMVRIGGSVYPWIKEADYYTKSGEFRVDKEGSPIMLNSLMYKLCYYRFGGIMTDYNKPTGWDRVRNVEIGNKDFTLEYVEEAYTTEHWLVRIYKVKKPETFNRT